MALPRHRERSVDLDRVRPARGAWHGFRWVWVPGLASGLAVYGVGGLFDSTSIAVTTSATCVASGAWAVVVRIAGRRQS
jgi:hypothetical protein